MADVNTIYEKVAALGQDIRQLIRFTGYNEYDGLKSVEADRNDLEQRFLLDEMWRVMKNLKNALDTLEYLGKPIEEVSTLHMNSRERYETEEGTELSCGFSLEALIYDAHYDFHYWAKTSIEHDGKRYYLYGYKEISLDGLKVRIRKLS